MDDVSYPRSITDKFMLASSTFKQQIKAEWLEVFFFLEVLFSNDVINDIHLKTHSSLG